MPIRSALPLPLSRDEFHAVFVQGEEAVFALFHQILMRLTEVEEQVSKNSGNSSKPPSSDGLSKKPLEPMTANTMSLRKKTGKKVGGQPKHPGKTLEQVDKPDHIVGHRPACCPDCQTCLAAVDAVAVDSSDSACHRQVFEMPIPHVVVTEHRLVGVTCPGSQVCERRCGKRCQGSFPEAVSQPVQYGPNLLGFATYLHGFHLLPFARCAQVLRDITGAPFSSGSLHRALQRVHEVLEPFDKSRYRPSSRSTCGRNGPAGGGQATLGSHSLYRQT